MNPISAKCPKLSLRSDILVSPSNCRSSNQAYGSTCSLACARGFRLSGSSSTQCGKGGVWNQRANTVRCEGVYYNFSVPNRIKLQLKYRSSLIRYVEADWKRQSPHWRPILTFFFYIFKPWTNTQIHTLTVVQGSVLGGGGGFDRTRRQNFWYLVVFQNDFAFSGKPLIFSTRWGIFYG